MYRVINTIKRLLHPTALVILSLIVLGFVVLLYGERVGYRGIRPFEAASVRELTVGTLWLIAGLWIIFLACRWIWRFFAARRTVTAHEPTEAELEADAMDKVFDAAVTTIRSRWSGTGRSVYGLPWFVVMGETGAGKTSLIDNGDMRFPIDHEIRAKVEAIGDFEATRFLNWRISGNEAVLIDLAGENVVPHEERTEVQHVLWRRFFRNLVKYRPRRPINGVIIAVDLLKFSQMSLTERESYAQTLRETIGDLVEETGTQLTVYFALTKLDLIAGFNDFFENLSTDMRERLFGFHFLHEGQHVESWDQQFEKQYSEFLKELERRLPTMLHSLKTPGMRRAAYAFHRLFNGLDAPIKEFLKAAVGGDKFSTPPLVRGVYFTSVRQENAPQNVFLEAVSQRYHISEPLYSAFRGNSRPYFVTKLFNQAIFPEAGLAGSNYRVEKRQRCRSFLALVMGLLVILGGYLFWNNRYDANLERVIAVEDKVKEFITQANSIDGGKIDENYLQPLDTIRDATLLFEDYRRINPILAGLTLYQGDKIGPIVDEAYLGVLNNDFMARLVNSVGEDLKVVCPKGSDDELNILRVYRMLGSLEGRQNEVISQYFANRWQKQFLANLEMQDGLSKHLQYALETEPRAYKLNEKLVDQSQEYLAAVTPYRRVFSSMLADANREYPTPIDFANTAGASFAIVYEADDSRNNAADESPTSQANEQVANKKAACALQVNDAHLVQSLQTSFTIPQFYSKKLFFNYFAPRNVEIATIAADDLWVMGAIKGNNYSEADFKAIQDNTRQIYVDEYIASWRRALNGLNVRHFETLRDATEELRAASGTESPLRRIAQLVAENSTIYKEDLPAADLPAEGTVEAENRRAGLRINAAFAGIRKMLEANEDGSPTQMDEILAALNALYSYVNQVAEAADPQAKALALALERSKLQGEDPIYVLRRIAEQAPAPFDDHLEALANEAWRSIMFEATSALNKKWQGEVYGEYQRLLAGKYPFDRNSTEDVPLEDFISFFGPDGTLQKFYREELLAFVEERTGEPIPVDGQTLTINKEFAVELKKSIAISQAFFDSEGNLNVSFKVEPKRMSSGLSRSILNFEGQIISYGRGPAQSSTVVWPNVVDGPIASRIDMSPASRNGTIAILERNGPWSWLRLYDAATKSNFSNNSVDVTYSSRAGSVTYQYRTESKVNPFFNSPLNEFSLPRNMSAQSQAASDKKARTTPQSLTDG